MERTAVSPKDVTIPEFLTGGGEMGQRIREYDWSATSLGPIDTWPHSLRTCVRIMLASRQPIWIGWGKDLIKLYNDPYKAIVGGKHPLALGKPASVVWKEIWNDIAPLLKGVMEKDQGSFSECQLLIMERNGYPEETYYTFSYTPVPGDDGGTAGMICFNAEETDRIINDRQLRTITSLQKRLTGVQSEKEVIDRTISTLQENPNDFLFSLYYTFRNNQAELLHHTDLGEALKSVPAIIPLESEEPIGCLLHRSAAAGKPQVIDELPRLLGKMPTGAWEVHPDKAIILPILHSGMEAPAGWLVLGLNPYRLLNDNYSSLFTLLADQVATSFAEVCRLEEERKRAEAMAEIDRAKTTFFSNISHEFRTPLTLLLGPIQDTLQLPETNEETRARMEVAYRNVLRMQKLVNTLLEFSRIEAGRVEGKFTRVNIALLTQGLVGSFRSAVEKAGMELHFVADRIEDEVYVDAEMWERIVLNLISNAFKYTKEGAIHVHIHQEGSFIKLHIKDTGVGIAQEELSRIFDRFHRVENSLGRSQEGTGIGLSMVRELVKIHHGAIDVSSQPGSGSTFTVTIPSGKKHLPEDKILGTDPYTPGAMHVSVFVEEALKWLPDQDDSHTANGVLTTLPDQAMASNASGKRSRVLLADDNADMRQYVQRLLSPHYEVITATNGKEALDKALHLQPDLIVSDIMMPVMDGFQLLNQLRSLADTRNMPVIFLSARAGQEARVEGLEAGADDYLVKPFSAKELLATVQANLKIAQGRIAAENNMKNVFRQSPVAMCIFRGEQLILEMANERALQLWGKKMEDLANRPVLETFPEIVEQGFDKILYDVYHTGVPFVAYEMPVMLIRHNVPETIFVNFIYEPLRNDQGIIDGIVGVATDVSVQVMARRKVEESEKELNELANAMAQLVWITDPAGKVLYFNSRIAEFAGIYQLPGGTWKWMDMVHPDDRKLTRQHWKIARKTQSIFQVAQRLQMKDGTFRWHLSRTIPQKDREGNIIKWFGTATDIHMAKEQATMLEQEVYKRTAELNDMNISLQQSNNDLQQFAHVASHDLKEPLRKIRTYAGRLEDDERSHFSDKAQVYLGKINSATNRMFTMIEGVLNYSMYNGAEHSIQLVDLNEIIEDIQSDLELPIQLKGAVIHYNRLPQIEGARVLLHQLFYNLLNNSLKFARQDITPMISITSNDIIVHKKTWKEISLQDNGIGFDQHYAEKIFDTFARLNSKDQYEGTGLGLSLCKKIVQRHGGSIKATGKRNEGATFIIQLPVRQERNSI